MHQTKDVELGAKLNMHSSAANRQDMFPAVGEREKIQHSCYTFLWSRSAQAWRTIMNNSFLKLKRKWGKTLLLLHQERNPGAVYFNMDGRLTLEDTRSILNTDDIREFGHFLCFITVKTTVKYSTSTSSKQFLSPQKCLIYCKWSSFRLCQIRNFLISSFGTDMSGRVCGLKWAIQDLSCAAHCFSLWASSNNTR